MGTKNKFWFERDDAMWLFKATRPDSGEHWAEVVAAGLAERLRLPHAHYELARWRGTAGAVTRRFTPEGHDLVHGNELLAERDPNYPREGARYLRPQEHTIEAVRAVVAAERLALPIGWEPPPGIESPVDVFGGYLLLDAWIGNTDRHHQNWALVVNPAQNLRYLAPTFDHASSLGAHAQDDERSRRLESRDPGFRVGAYVQRADARSSFYLRPGETRRLSPVDAFRAWAAQSRCQPWLEQLQSVTDQETEGLIAALPSTEISGPARAFAQAILTANKGRILEGR